MLDVIAHQIHKQFIFSLYFCSELYEGCYDDHYKQTSQANNYPTLAIILSAELLPTTNHGQRVIKYVLHVDTVWRAY